MKSHIGASGFIGRWLLALLVVLGTYNPSGYSYVSWVWADGAGFGPVVAIVGILLLIGWIFCLRATFNALGWLGVILGGALFSAVIWLLIDTGLISLDSTGILTWLSLIVVSLILAVGMAWSFIKRRLTGQLNVDDIDD